MSLPQSLAHIISSSLKGDDSHPTIPFSDFKQRIYRHYQNALHLNYLDHILADVSRYAASGQGIARLIIEMPPRHGKTITVSRLFPAWHLACHPDHRVMLVSYAADLAQANSRAARSIIDGFAFRSLFPHIALNRSSRNVANWELMHQRGGVAALGILGSATGKGANLLIIDDPVKNRQEAESDLIRDRVWASFNDDLMTRLEPHGAVILMMTRWHTDDLIGRVLKYSGEEWVRLRFPALAEENDPLGRAPGQALWPERFDEAKLQSIREQLGEYSFASLYQQEPISMSGGLFKRAWFYPLIDHLPPMRQAVRYWDLAMSSKSTADFSVGVKLGWGMDGHFYVLDVARARIEWGELVAWMSQIIQADGIECLQGIEAQGYMSRAIQELNLDPRLKSHSIYGYPKEVDKFTAALPFAARCSAGLVHVLDAHWTNAFIDELCAFNQGEHDDQVDAASGAYAMLNQNDAIGAMNYADAHRISAW